MGKCDLKCPQVPGHVPMIARCCVWCARARKGYVTSDNKDLWDERTGFLGEKGCRLSREQMPAECKSYDCKTIAWMVCSIKYAPLVWDGETWKQLQCIEGFFVGMLNKTDELLIAIKDNIEKCNKEKTEEVEEILRVNKHD